MVRLKLLGVGAMNSPRFAPAGLLVSAGRVRVVIDGGPGSAPDGPVTAWLVSDERSELRRAIRELAHSSGVQPAVTAFRAGPLLIEPRSVDHTSHPTFGYLVSTSGERAVWAPEFWRFPEWAANAELMFAEAAGWNRSIRFAGGVGGHAAALDVAAVAKAARVRRLVFAHIGRPTLRAMDAGQSPPFGEFGVEGRSYRL